MIRHTSAATHGNFCPGQRVYLPEEEVHVRIAHILYEPGSGRPIYKLKADGKTIGYRYGDDLTWEQS